MNNENNFENNVGINPTPVSPEVPNVDPVSYVPQEPAVETTPVVNTVPAAEPTPVVNPVPSVEPTPVVEEPVVEVTPVVETPVVEPTPVINDTIDDGVSTGNTVDYNSLYGQINDITSDVEDKNKELEDTQAVFKAQDLDIQNRSLNNRSSQDITPDFNISALDKNTKEEDSKANDNVLTDKQQDKADTRRRILFILTIALIIVIFVKFIFPILRNM